MRAAVSKLRSKPALPALMLTAATAAVAVNHGQRRRQYVAAQANRFSAEAKRLARGVGLNDPLAISETFRFEPASRGSVWWTVEGRARDGTLLHSVWSESTGDLCYMSCISNSVNVNSTKEVSKSEAIAGARDYTRGAFLGTAYTNARLIRAEHSTKTWRVYERVCKSTMQPLQVLRTDIDSCTGRLLGMRIMKETGLEE